MNLSERTRGAKRTFFRPPDPVRLAIARASGATLPRSSQQVASRQVKIGQCRSHVQAMRILGQATVANFGKAEDALDDADDVLDLGAHPRLGLVLSPFDLIDYSALAVAAIDEVLGPWRSCPDHVTLAAIRLIA